MDRETELRREGAMMAFEHAKKKEWDVFFGAIDDKFLDEWVKGAIPEPAERERALVERAVRELWPDVEDLQWGESLGNLTGRTCGERIVLWSPHGYKCCIAAINSTVARYKREEASHA